MDVLKQMEKQEEVSGYPGKQDRDVYCPHGYSLYEIVREKKLRDGTVRVD